MELEIFFAFPRHSIDLGSIIAVLSKILMLVDYNLYNVYDATDYASLFTLTWHHCWCLFYARFVWIKCWCLSLVYGLLINLGNFFFFKYLEIPWIILALFVCIFLFVGSFYIICTSVFAWRHTSNLA